MKISSQSLPLKPKKLRSPLTQLDTTVLKRLADLHPWTILKICEKVDISLSSFSHVTGGRRPLPTRVALKVFDLLGLTSDSGLSSNHCFLFEDKPGFEVELRQQLGHIYPQGAKVVYLKSGLVHILRQAGEELSETGALFYAGNYYTIVHKLSESTYADLLTLPGEWGMTHTNDCADELLSLRVLPSKADAVSSLMDPAERDMPQVSWTEVNIFGQKWGVNPALVLEMLKNHIAPLKKMQNSLGLSERDEDDHD
jgi:hypothetical protein